MGDDDTEVCGNIAPRDVISLPHGAAMPDVPSTPPPERQMRNLLACAVAWILLGCAGLGTAPAPVRNSPQPAPIELSPSLVLSRTPTPMTWEDSDGDHFGVFAGTAGNARHTREGVPVGPDMTQSSNVWIGCMEGRPTVAFLLMPMSDRPVSISHDGVNWPPPEVRRIGPYGLAGHTYPAADNTLAVLASLEESPVLFAKWSQPAASELRLDAREFVVGFNLTHWRDAVERARRHCKGWPP